MIVEIDLDPKVTLEDAIKSFAAELELHRDSINRIILNGKFFSCLDTLKSLAHFKIKPPAVFHLTQHVTPSVDHAPIHSCDSVDNAMILQTICPSCTTAMDTGPRPVECKECQCLSCGLSESDPGAIVACLVCEKWCHLGCLPEGSSVPDINNWYCPVDKPVDMSVISKPVSSTLKPTPGCSIVPKDFVGHVPGTNVGQVYASRATLAGDGIHRPHVAGLFGSPETGLLSLVINGGSNEDFGDFALVLGSGGQGYDLPRQYGKSKSSDKSKIPGKNGKNLTGLQAEDQKLKGCNLAIAKTLWNVDPDSSGVFVKAKDWQKSQAVRFCRGSQLKSSYAPKFGYRYDGLYKCAGYSKKRIVWISCILFPFCPR